MTCCLAFANDSRFSVQEFLFLILPSRLSVSPRLRSISYLSLSAPLCLAVCVSLYLSVSACNWLCMSLCIWLCLSVCSWLCLSVCSWLYLSVSICLRLSASVCVLCVCLVFFQSDSLSINKPCPSVPLNISLYASAVILSCLLLR